MGWGVALSPEDGQATGVATPLSTRTLPLHQSSVAINFLGRDYVLHYDWVLKSPVLLRPWMITMVIVS